MTTICAIRGRHVVRSGYTGSLPVVETWCGRILSQDSRLYAFEPFNITCVECIDRGSVVIEDLPVDNDFTIPGRGLTFMYDTKNAGEVHVGQRFTHAGSIYRITGIEMQGYYSVVGLNVHRVSDAPNKG